MKKIISILLMIVLCISMTACAEKEDKESDSQNTVESVQEMRFYPLTTEDGGKSVNILQPEEYEQTESSSKVQRSFECEKENGTSQIMMKLLDQSTDEVAETLRQEIQYMMSANAEGEQTMEEVQTMTAEDKQVSYFRYAYDTPENKVEGYYCWTALENGSVFVYMIENVGDGMDSLVVDSVVNSMLSHLQE